MASIRPFHIGWMVCICVIFAIGTSAFTGNFEITDLILDCPSEVNATSTASSFLSFNFVDQDTPQNPPAHCCLEWAAGKTPTPLPTSDSCSDNNITVCVAEGLYGGFKNVTVSLAHQYEDDSIGEAPYNGLTKYAYLYLVYPSTPDYECDVNRGCCESCEGTTMTAIVMDATG